MNFRIFLGAIIGAQMASGACITAVAQSATSTGATHASPVASTADSATSYDSQALRLESHWGEYRVIRGAKGPIIGTVGPIRSFDVEQLVARSPVAVAEARVYRANHFPASIVGTA